MEACAGAELLLLPTLAPLPALPLLPPPLSPLLSERLRLWLGAVPWPPSSAGRPLGRAEEELAPFRVSVAPPLLSGYFQGASSKLNKHEQTSNVCTNCP